MIKKYYDENNHIIGITYGKLSENSVDISTEEAKLIIHLLSGKPVQKDYNIYLIDNINQDSGTQYDYIYEKVPDSQMSDEDIKQKFIEEIMNSINVGSRPAEKEGFNIVPRFNGTFVYWEYEAIPSQDISIEENNSYLNPIQYNNGMEVKAGFWYSDNNNIWEAIKDGIPIDFNDTEYFDIIVV